MNKNKLILEELDKRLLLSFIAYSNTLYLDFDGDVVSNNTSNDFDLGQSVVNIPSFDLSNQGFGGLEEEAIDHIINYVKEDYSAYDIEVTDKKPIRGKYTTIYVGGNGWNSLTNRIYGIATLDISNTSPVNYGFAFTENMSYFLNFSDNNVQVFSEYLSTLISHEAGHTFGLEHISNDEAIMYPSIVNNPRNKSFEAGSLYSKGYQDSQSLLGINLGYVNEIEDAEIINKKSITPGMFERRGDIPSFEFLYYFSEEIKLSQVIFMDQKNIDYTISINSIEANHSGIYALEVNPELCQEPSISCLLDLGSLFLSI